MRFLLVLLLMTFAHTAFGQVSDLDRAQQHFEAGRRHRKAGHCDLAIEEFKRALDFAPTRIGPRLNLGDCYASLGRLPEAFREFKEAERIAEQSNNSRLDIARKSAAEIEAKLVRVILREEEPVVPNLSVEVDGVPAGPRPFMIVVTPDSEHTLHASTPDGRQWTAKASGRAGQVVRLTVAFSGGPHVFVGSAQPQRSGLEKPPEGPEAPSSARVPEKPQDEGSGLRTAGIVTGAAGATVLAAGGVLGVLTLVWKGDLAKAHDADSRCSGTYPNGTCPAEVRAKLDPIEDRAFLASTLSTIGFIAGGVLLASGVGLYVFGKGGSSRVRARLGPGAWLEGSF